MKPKTLKPVRPSLPPGLAFCRTFSAALAAARRAECRHAHSYTINARTGQRRCLTCGYQYNAAEVQS
jgi:hypothetical protein